MSKYVYSFGGGKADGNESMKNLLGGKGANLAEMAGHPTSVCPCRRASPSPPRSAPTTTSTSKTYPSELKAQVERSARRGREADGARSSATRRIRCSCRSAPARVAPCRA